MPHKHGCARHCVTGLGTWGEAGVLACSFSSRLCLGLRLLKVSKWPEQGVFSDLGSRAPYSQLVSCKYSISKGLGGES